MPKKTTIVFTCLLLLACVAVAASPGAETLIHQIKTGGHVLMIRHALAPGTGDPDHFKIGDCATQRNLNEQGRSQARNIGRWLRSRGIDNVRVFSSQWCRCLETAELIDLGPVSALPALNSFFDRPQDEEPNLAALGVFFSEQPADGALIILVTHFVTIAGITNESVSSGEGVLMRLTGTDRIEVIGRLDFENGDLNGNM